LSESLGGMERGRGGKGEREGWGDHLPYYPPPPLASASNTTLGLGSGLPWVAGHSLAL